MFRGLRLLVFALATFACARRTASSDAKPAVPSAASTPLHLFVGSRDGTIRVFAVDDAEGTLTFRHQANAGEHPSFLAFDPSRRRVIATDERDPGLVRSFAFEPSSGALTEIGAAPTGGAGTTHVSLDPTGRWVMAANYLGGSTSLLPLAADGALGDATDTKASGAKSHWAGTSPSGTHVFVVSLGDDQIKQYELEPKHGTLLENGAVALPKGTGPRHLAFHPNERWAYSINELAVTVTAFDHEPRTGKLSVKQSIPALPADRAHTDDVTGAELFVHPNGRTLYASTRGDDTLVVFAIDPQRGTLARLANTPTGGRGPRSFAISPEGHLLFVGHQHDDTVMAFRLEAETGHLRPLGQKVRVASPTFVGLARMR